MAEETVLDERVLRLLEEFRDRSVENSLRNFTAFDEQEIVEALARRARELGNASIRDLRSVLLPESSFDSSFAEGAARALAELGDCDALALVIYQAAKLWDASAKAGVELGGGRGFARFLQAARRLMPGALENGPLPEGVIKALTIFVQHVDDWGDYSSVYETAACTGSPALRDELTKIVSKGLGDDWTRRSHALYALRHYPEMQPTMMEAMSHPEEKVASRAADAVVEMLGIIPGCGEKEYERWKAWAMTQVPPELQVKPRSRADILFKRELRMDRRQTYFWNACSRAHQKAMRELNR
ncbi:MAG: hypothetical protein NTU91_12005 [Chloroflexi bacterium]|nr:hypothetical protein [Chloroflexota bacterium]